MQPADAGDLRGRVPGLLPDAAGGSGERGHSGTSSRTPPPTTTRRSIRCLASGLSPVYTRQPKPDQISCQLDQHTTDERSNEGKVGIKMFNLQLSFKARNSKSNSNSDKFKMCLIFKVLSFKEGGATPCPSTTPVQWCSTRTRSRSSSSTPRRPSRWTG